MGDTNRLPIVEKLLHDCSGFGIGPALVTQEAAAVISALYGALRTARVALWAIEDSAVESGFGKLGDIIAEQLAAANAAIELAESQA